MSKGSKAKDPRLSRGVSVTHVANECMHDQYAFSFGGGVYFRLVCQLEFSNTILWITVLVVILHSKRLLLYGAKS